MQIPAEILQQIVSWARANNIGMAQVIEKETDVTLLLFGPSAMTPNEASLIAAHQLIISVLAGYANASNEAKIEEIKAISTEKKYWTN